MVEYQSALSQHWVICTTVKALNIYQNAFIMCWITTEHSIYSCLSPVYVVGICFVPIWFPLWAGCYSSKVKRRRILFTYKIKEQFTYLSISLFFPEFLMGFFFRSSSILNDTSDLINKYLANGVVLIDYNYLI